MKKFLSLLIIATIITSTLCVSYFAKENISTQDAGNSVTTDVTTEPTTNTEVTTTEPTTESSTEPTAPKKITLNKSSVTIHAGKSYQLKVTTPNVNTGDVTWKTSNSRVATVSSTGVVKGVKSGSAYITVTLKSNKRISARCKFVILQYAKSVSLSKTSLKLYTNESSTLKAKVSPSSTSKKTLKWTSYNKNIVTVSSNGVVKSYNRTGHTTIKVETTDGSRKYKTCKVSVIPRAKGMTISKSLVATYSGEDVKLTAKITNKSIKNKKILWSTSNSNVAVVSSAGYVIATGPGYCYITAKSAENNSNYAVCKFVVRQLVTSLRSDISAKTILVNNTTRFDTIIEPTNASNTKLTYTSGNNNIATVDSDGYITGVNPGKVTITAKTTDGSNKSTRLTVTVIQEIPTDTSMSSDEFNTENSISTFCYNANKYFESCGAKINPELVKNSYSHYTSCSIDFNDGSTIKDYLVKSIGYWTNKQASKEVNLGGTWNNIYSEENIKDFLNEVDEISSNKNTTYNPDKVLDMEWNGWQNYCNNSVSVYVTAEPVKISSGETYYFINFYYDY